LKIFTYVKDDSSRVSKKNFQKIGSLDLWKHLIYELSDYDIFIDTDSTEVIDECSRDPILKNVTAYERERRFIDMENDPKNRLSPSLLMTENFLDKFVSDPNEAIVLTHVTSPFLKKESVERALEYLDSGYDFVHSVHSIQDFAWIGDSFRTLNFDSSVVQRTQDVEKIHFSKGAFFIFTKRNFKKYKNRLGEKNFYYQLSHLESVEIDTQEDLEFARILYKGINNA
jgi:CMP-N-acetylneuraminic acid synthetase